MNTIDELLIKLDACKKAKDWAQGKNFVEVYTTCERGDWLNWLFAKTNPEDVQLLTLVKGHQANTVRHLMTDERSIKAVDTAIAFGEGRATKEELSRAADEAEYAYFVEANDSSASCAAACAADYAKAACTAYSSAAEAAWAAAWAACIAADAGYAAAADAAAAAASDAGAYAAEQANQKLTADIFRKYISIDKFNI